MSDLEAEHSESSGSDAGRSGSDASNSSERTSLKPDGGGSRERVGIEEQRTSGKAAPPDEGGAPGNDTTALPAPDGNDSRTLPDPSQMLAQYAPYGPPAPEPVETKDPGRSIDAEHSEWEPIQSEEPPNASREPELPNQSEGPPVHQELERTAPGPQSREPLPPREANQSEKPPDHSEYEPIQSTQPHQEPIYSRPERTESETTDPRQSMEPSEKSSQPRKEGPDTSDPKRDTSVVHPIDGRHTPGRGATGPGGHGLERDPNTKEWYNKGANDRLAPPGTRVVAPFSGTVHVERHSDPRTGKHFGDTVTITSENKTLKVSLMHIDAAKGLENTRTEKDFKDGGAKKDSKEATIKMGQEVGTVANWEDNPRESHLHIGLATRTADGTYRAADPEYMLRETEGGVGRVATVTDGRYSIGPIRQ